MKSYTKLFLDESKLRPAVAFAVEVKALTAKDKLIGTGKVDYNGTFITSKAIGSLDIHFNVGYSVLGKPDGITLNNTVNSALGCEFHVSNEFSLVAEVLANTAPSKDDAPKTRGPRQPMFH